MSLQERTELLSGEEGSSRSCTPTVPLSAVEDLVETVVVLRKEPTTHEIGISVVGGVDTYLGCVVVEGVAEGGPAWLDGRLQRGDILLQVNDESLVHSTREEAVKALRQCSSPVSLLVLREDPEQLFTTTQEPTKFITVELRKSSVAERLGLSLMERRDGNGIFVTLVEPGSLAARYGRIMQGDKLLEVNGSPVAYLSLHHLALHLRSMEGSVVVVVGRVPSLARSVQQWARSLPPSTTTSQQPPARPRIHTWSHSTPHTRLTECPSPALDDASSGGSRALLLGRLRAHTHNARTRATKFPRPPSLIHILRRSLRARNTSSSTHTVIRASCTTQVLMSGGSAPDSPQLPARVYNTEVICTDDTESCGSDKPFLSDVKVTSF
ncbi:multiple PDZ domain protein-like isoform X2 [Homarus americanus]|uniref:multiple PDZ domain protein-like isoform X2 n=1 Tax=Homarus americanus TaxID=6706 RepID=UPI001C44BEE0|nr:multiple PDZ domain protein-like isoform X2 [Homarus americanus]